MNEDALSFSGKDESQHRRHQEAFTLIEVSVVIAVMAILIVMALPAFNKAQSMALLGKCTANLHQVHVVWQQYATENNGMVPPYYWNDPGSGNNGLAWGEILRRFGTLEESTTETSRVPTMAQCPANPWRVGYWRDPNYSYNQWMGNYDSRDSNYLAASYRIRMAQLDQPSKVAIFADAGKRNSGITDIRYPSTTVWDHFVSVIPSKTTSWVGYQWHDGRSNFLFADGHVEALTLNEATTRYNNNTLLVRRGNISPW